MFVNIPNINTGNGQDSILCKSVKGESLQVWNLALSKFGKRITLLIN